jgi:hypothetical protein
MAAGAMQGGVDVAQWALGAVGSAARACGALGYGVITLKLERPYQLLFLGMGGPMICPFPQLSPMRHSHPHANIMICVEMNGAFVHKDCMM